MDPTERRRLVLVFGASGYIGSNLIAALIAARVRVRAAARNRCLLESRGWSEVELIEADALDAESLPAALDGVDTAYYLVHSMAAGKRFGDLDVAAARHFAAAASRAFVRRIVYLGGLAPPGADSDHLLSRKRTGECLRSGSVPVTEIRAGIIVGAGSAAFEVIRDLVYHLPLMVTPRWVRSKSSPIALSNVIEYLLRIPECAETAGQSYHAAGPEYLSYEQLLRQFGQIVGRHPWILPVPVLSPQLSSYWLALITAVPTNIARALIQGLKHDVPADDGPLRRLFPQRLLSFKEAVCAALEAEQQGKVPARWTEGAFAIRRFRHDYSFYAKQAAGSAETTASPQALWRIVTSLGGMTGYFYANWLWRLRECIDWLAGGPGFTRGRRRGAHLRIGDRIDYWTVVGAEPGRRLTLDFGLKGPGAGIVEFEIHSLQRNRACIKVTAYWHPQGVWGLLYWWALVPFHLFIFKGMTRVIAPCRSNVCNLARSKVAHKKLNSNHGLIQRNHRNARYDNTNMAWSRCRTLRFADRAARRNLLLPRQYGGVSSLACADARSGHHGDRLCRLEVQRRAAYQQPHIARQVSVVRFEMHGAVSGEDAVGHRIAIRFHDSRVTIDSHTPGSALAALSALRHSRADGAPAAIGWLARFGVNRIGTIDVEWRIRGLTVARAGQNARATWLGRLLTRLPIEIHWIHLMRVILHV